MDQDETSVELKPIPPTDEQYRSGYEKLQTCLPAWKKALGLLVTSEGHVCTIVSVVDCVHDKWGFRLRLEIRERLVSHPDVERPDCSVACMWNQPYIYFDEESLSAPYSFYLHFGNDGVERALKVHTHLKAKSSEPFNPRVLRGCFGRRGPENTTDMLS